MLDFNCKFYVLNDAKYGFPSGISHNMRFRLCLNTGYRMIDCEICYLGADLVMQPDKWYDGLVYLPYGEAFRPFGEKFQESILPGEYELFYASECVGKCQTISLNKFYGEFQFDD